MKNEGGPWSKPGAFDGAIEELKKLQEVDPMAGVRTKAVRSVKLSEAIDQAVRRLERNGERLKNTTLTEPGQRFVFKETSLCEWVILRQDEDAWFMVPYDQNPFIGGADVEIHESEEIEPAALRCAHGIWVGFDKTTSKNRCGFVEMDTIIEARNKVAALATGKVEFNEVDKLPDYLEWDEYLTNARMSLEEFLND